jgi:hypothetical protein
MVKKYNNESLDIILTEQRRDQDYLLHIYNRMRAGQNILLAAAIGVLTYLSSGLVSKDELLSEKFFFPDQDYGKVIYVLAAGFFLFGIIKLMINVFGVHPWTTSYDEDQKEYNEDSETVKLYFIKKNDEASGKNGHSYFKHRAELTYLFYSITISAIILLVIKTLG